MEQPVAQEDKQDVKKLYAGIKYVLQMLDGWRFDSDANSYIASRFDHYGNQLINEALIPTLVALGKSTVLPKYGKDVSTGSGLYHFGRNYGRDVSPNRKAARWGIKERLEEPDGAPINERNQGLIAIYPSNRFNIQKESRVRLADESEDEEEDSRKERRVDPLDDGRHWF